MDTPRAFLLCLSPGSLVSLQLLPYLSMPSRQRKIPRKGREISAVIKGMADNCSYLFNPVIGNKIVLAW